MPSPQLVAAGESLAEESGRPGRPSQKAQDHGTGNQALSKAPSTDHQQSRPVPTALQPSWPRPSSRRAIASSKCSSHSLHTQQQGELGIEQAAKLPVDPTSRAHHTSLMHILQLLVFWQKLFHAHLLWLSKLTRPTGIETTCNKYHSNSMCLGLQNAALQKRLCLCGAVYFRLQAAHVWSTKTTCDSCSCHLGQMEDIHLTSSLYMCAIIEEPTQARTI